MRLLTYEEDREYLFAVSERYRQKKKQSSIKELHSPRSHLLGAWPEHELQQIYRKRSPADRFSCLDFCISHPLKLFV